jgi:hypothetical protein
MMARLGARLGTGAFVIQKNHSQILRLETTNSWIELVSQALQFSRLGERQIRIYRPKVGESVPDSFDVLANAAASICYWDPIMAIANSVANVKKTTGSTITSIAW